MKKIAYTGLQHFINDKNLSEINWALTDRCNYSCHYCELWEIGKQELRYDVDHYHRVIDFIYEQESTVEKLIITGGEPTVSKHFESILNYLNYKQTHNPDKILAIHLNSNMSRDVNYYIDYYDRLNQFKRVIIMPSFHKEFIDRIKFFNVCQTLHELNYEMYDIRFMMHTLECYEAYKLTIKEFPDLLISPMPISGKEHLFDVDLNKQDFLKNNLVVYFEDTTNKYTIDYKRLKRIKFKNYLCNTYQQLITIQPNGDIFPCPNYRTILKIPSNIHDDNVLDIISKNKQILCQSHMCSCYENIPKVHISHMHLTKLTYDELLEFGD